PAFFTQMENAGGYLLSRGIAPVWIGEFGTDTGSLANFGLAPSSRVGNAAHGGWWKHIQAWLAGTDADWCRWGLDPSHVTGRSPPGSNGYKGRCKSYLVRPRTHFGNVGRLPRHEPRET